MVDQDYANTARKIECLGNMGFPIRFSKDGGQWVASCNRYKCHVGYGGTIAQALAKLEHNLLCAGFLKVER